MTTYEMEVRSGPMAVPMRVVGYISPKPTVVCVTRTHLGTEKHMYQRKVTWKSIEISRQ